MKSRKLLGRHVCGSMMALSADLVWYGLGRWRGPQALELLGRLSPKPRTFIRRAQSGFLANVGLFQLSSRFLPSSIRSRPALPARRGHGHARGGYRWRDHARREIVVDKRL